MIYLGLSEAVDLDGRGLYIYNYYNGGWSARLMFWMSRMTISTVWSLGSRVMKRISSVRERMCLTGQGRPSSQWVTTLSSRAAAVDDGVVDGVE